MSETKWIRGPWGLAWDEGRPLAIVGGYVTIAAMYGYETDAGKSNARLIAAAPELYDALTALLDRYCDLVNSGDAGNWNPEDEPQVANARAAMRKARGEA